MKKILPFLFLFFFCNMFACAQQSYIDSLLRLLSRTKADTTRVKLLYELSSIYVLSKPDTGLIFGQEGLKLAQSLGNEKGEIDCKESLALNWWAVGEYTTAVKLLLDVIKFYETQKNTTFQQYLYTLLAIAYRDQGDFSEALQYMQKSDEFANHCLGCRKNSDATGSIYYEMNKLDSALVYLKKVEVVVMAGDH